jgi:hypothetical protein
VAGDRKRIGMMVLSKDSLDTLYHGVDYLQEAVRRAHDELRHKQDEALKLLIKDRLADLGHIFQDDSHFFDFVKVRLRRIEFEGDPGSYQIRLDFIDAKEPGILLATFSTKITMEGNGGNITFTIG